MFASAAAPEPGKAERQVWFPGNKAPDYLDGSLPGDFGFDPLGLGSDPQTLRWCAARAARAATATKHSDLCCFCIKLCQGPHTMTIVFLKVASCCSCVSRQQCVAG